MRRNRIALLLAALGAALFVFGQRGRAADGNFPIYFDNSKLIVKSENINRTLYLPVQEILAHLGLPYTDAIALETLTVRSGNSRLVASKNSGLIALNDQIILLPNPVLREGDRWLAPVDFLTQGLGRMTGTQFRYRAGTPRLFVGNVEAPELVMNAQTLGAITRLTIRCAVPMNLDLRTANNRAVLTINRGPVDPLRERLDHKDRLVQAITFDDSDGISKITLDLTNDVADINMTPADNNRIYFVDVMRKGVPTTAVPPLPETNAALKPDVRQADHKVRVVAIDPGHGGMDVGAKGETLTEKDLMLVLARKLRTALQMRLGATVVLTRDSDIELDNETRSAAANNNQANLFISLHAGYSASKTITRSSVFIMNGNFGETSGTSVVRDQLFPPWYLGYRANRAVSGQAAKILSEELSKAIMGWEFPVRTAPLAILSSATMPSLLLEIGNLNNPVNTQTMMDGAFQNRLVDAIVAAVQRFSETQQTAAN